MINLISASVILEYLTCPVQVRHGPRESLAIEIGIHDGGGYQETSMNPLREHNRYRKPAGIISGLLLNFLRRQLARPQPKGQPLARSFHTWADNTRIYLSLKRELTAVVMAERTQL